MANVSRTYFGEVDASTSCLNDDELESIFFRGGSYTDISFEGDSKKPAVIVGIKGSGKTALGRSLAREFSGQSWFRDEESSGIVFDVPGDIPRSGTSLHSVKLFIVDQFVAHLNETKAISPTKAEAIWGEVRTRGKAFLEETEGQVAGIKFNLNALFASGNTSDIKKTADAALEKIAMELPGEKFLIVLDDVDSYFVEMENSPRFIEALCRAAKNINRSTQANIRCVVLLKHGVWRSLFNRPEEYDKVKNDIEFLGWSFEEILGLMAKRVAAIHNEKEEDIDSMPSKLRMLKKEFKGNNSEIEDCLKAVFSFSANGPRDAIDLCNKAKVKAKSKKITLEDVRSSDVISLYSEEKLKGVNQDFGHLYPYFPEFTQFTFKDYKAEFTGEEFKDYLDAKVLNELNNLNQSFAGEDWCRDATADSMVKIFFDVGVLGISRDGALPLFAIEENFPDQTTLLNSNLLVHNAYRPALGLPIA